MLPRNLCKQGHVPAPETDKVGKRLTFTPGKQGFTKCLHLRRLPVQVSTAVKGISAVDINEPIWVSNPIIHNITPPMHLYSHRASSFHPSATWTTVFYSWLCLQRRHFSLLCCNPTWKMCSWYKCCMPPKLPFILHDGLFKQNLYNLASWRKLLGLCSPTTNPSPIRSTNHVPVFQKSMGTVAFLGTQHLDIIVLFTLVLFLSKDMWVFV